MITHTISVTELLWTTFGLVGLGITIANLRDVISILGQVERQIKKGWTNGDWLAIAASSVRQETLRVIAMLVTVGIGFSAMLLPPANPDLPVSPLQIIVTVGLFVISGVTALQSYLDRKLRHYLMEDGHGSQAR